MSLKAIVKHIKLYQIMIAFRLLLHRRHMRVATGVVHSSSRGGKHYLSIVGILVESAFTYASICTVFLILFKINSPAVEWWASLMTVASVREVDCDGEYRLTLLLLPVLLPVVDSASHLFGHGRQFNFNCCHVQR
jgi:hypothetical protein